MSTCGFGFILKKPHSLESSDFCMHKEKGGSGWFLIWLSSNCTSRKCGFRNLTQTKCTYYNDSVLLHLGLSLSYIHLTLLYHNPIATLMTYPLHESCTYQYIFKVVMLLSLVGGQSTSLLYKWSICLFIIPSNGHRHLFIQVFRNHQIFALVKQ